MKHMLRSSVGLTAALAVAVIAGGASVLAKVFDRREDAATDQVSLKVREPVLVGLGDAAMIPCA